MVRIKRASPILANIPLKYIIRDMLDLCKSPSYIYFLFILLTFMKYTEGKKLSNYL